MNPKSIKIGVVTVTYNGADILDDFFQSVQQQTGCNYNLYVVDNASSDQTLEKIAFAQAKNKAINLISNNDNLGVAEGNNQGIKQALNDGCNAILLLNNDTTFEPTFFSSLVDSLVKNNDQILVPKIYYHDRPDLIWCAGGELQLWRGYAVKHFGFNQTDNQRNNTRKVIDYSPTCAMIIMASVFEKIGLMDEKYFVYCDDTDFCIRAKLAGIPIVYEPEVSIWHKVSSICGLNSPFSIKMSTRNRIYMIKKFSPLYTHCYYYFINQVEYVLRVLVKGERMAEYKLRQKSFFDGLRMKL